MPRKKRPARLVPPARSESALPPAALGLTCKEALGVFAQYETLQLEKEKAALQARVARHEFAPRRMRCDDKSTLETGWRRVMNLDRLLQWVDEHVHGCEWQDMVRYGQIGAICDEMAFTQAVEQQLAEFYDSPAFCGRQAESMVQEVDLVMTFVWRYADPEHEAPRFTAFCAKKMLGDILEEVFSRFDFRHRRYVCTKCHPEQAVGV